MNFPLLSYVAEISPRPVLLIHGEKAHSRYFSETASAAAAEPKELLIIKGANHVDLYDQAKVIPFDKLTAFFTKLWQEYRQAHPTGYGYSRFCVRRGTHIRLGKR